jgi:cytochrome oxidase assembly protein ShyY1
MKKTLLAPKWIIGHILIVIVVITCLFLSLWQLQRLSQRKAINAKIIAQANKEKLTCENFTNFKNVNYRVFSDVLEIQEETYFVRGRSRDELPGLAVLKIGVCKDTGISLLLNIGWTPLAQDSQLKNIDIEQNREKVVAQVLPKEKPNFLQKADLKADKPFFSRPDPQVLSKILDIELQNDYLLLKGKSEHGLKTFEEVVPTEKSHLAYAIQWASFAVIGLFIWVLICTKELKKQKNK